MHERILDEEFATTINLKDRRSLEKLGSMLFCKRTQSSWSSIVFPSKFSAPAV